MSRYAVGIESFGKERERRITIHEGRRNMREYCSIRGLRDERNGLRTEGYMIK